MDPCCGTVEVHSTGLKLPRLGFGCSRLFGGSEIKASARLIEAAVFAGVLHFDTAPSYAYGQSESVLGDVLAGEHGVSVATKVGLPVVGAPSRAATFYRRAIKPVLANVPVLKSSFLRLRPRLVFTGPAVPRRVLGWDEINASLAESLGRLRRTKIDVLLLHEPDQFVIDDALRERFQTLVQNGTIVSYGLGYGRCVAGVVPFGHVVQSAYDASVPTTVAPPTPIYHGVLRCRTGATASAAVRAALCARRDVAVLFSASTPFQIRDVVSEL